VIFTLGGFWLHPFSFFMTGLIIMAGTQFEYYKIIQNTGINTQTVPGMISGVVTYVLATLIAAGLIDIKYFLLIIPCIAIILVAELFRHQERPFDSLAHTLFGIVYTSAPFSLFPFTAFSWSGIRSLIPHEKIIFSPGIVIGFFILLWVNDTGAYLSGITMGRHRLMERISPKKSWEGFFGGILLTILAGWLLSGWLNILDSFKWIFVALIIALCGTFGDLIESMLKRSTGIKDSGTIMPGHGGFLDRFDSTLLSFPLVFLFIIFFG